MKGTTIIMYLCSDHHEEVCYEGRNCPACMEMETTKEKESEIEELKKQIADLERQIEVITSTPTGE